MFSTKVKAYQIMIWITIWAGINYFGFVGYALAIVIWVGITFSDVRTPVLTIIQSINLSAASYLFLPMAKQSLADTQTRVIQFVYISKPWLILIGIILAGFLCWRLYSRWREHLFDGAREINRVLSGSTSFVDKISAVLNKAIEPNMPTINQEAPHRIWLNIDYKDRQKAKAKGARWDSAARSWYVMSNQDLSLFSEWM